MSYSQVLSRIYDHTYKMLELAQGGDWQELIQAETIRSGLLEELSMFNPDESEQNLEKTLKEIIEVNKLITAISIKEKNSCVNDFSQLKASKKLKSAYLRY